MDISLHSHYGIFTTQQGYWVAGKNIVESLETLGHRVTYDDPTADVMINFSQPQDYRKYPGQYTIGYTPWESTGMGGVRGGQQTMPQSLVGFGIGYQDESRPLEVWPKMIMDKCDEFWTTNQEGMRAFKAGGVTLPTKIFPHGIDHAWEPIERSGTGPITFLHVGEPAPRKGGQMTFECFKELFGNNPDYRLIIKSVGPSTIRDRDGAGDIRVPTDLVNNVTVITGELSREEMIGVFYNADCLIYPSYGEGFGFIPLQALATGLPVIMTDQWADYANEPGVLGVDSNYLDSPWPDIHPGNVLEPDRRQLKMMMRRFSMFRNSVQSDCYANALNIHAKHDWVVLTRNAFKDLEAKFS